MSSRLAAKAHLLRQEVCNAMASWAQHTRQQGRDKGQARKIAAADTYLYEYKGQRQSSGFGNMLIGLHEVQGLLPIAVQQAPVGCLLLLQLLHLNTLPLCTRP